MGQKNILGEIIPNGPWYLCVYTSCACEGHGTDSVSWYSIWCSDYVVLPVTFVDGTGFVRQVNCRAISEIEIIDGEQ